MKKIYALTLFLAMAGSLFAQEKNLTPANHTDAGFPNAFNENVQISNFIPAAGYPGAGYASFDNALLDDFFDVVDYVGAFSPTAGTDNWAAGWTEWDPINATYPATTVDITADITTNTTWTSDNVYHINGNIIFVRNDATLTIEPGTVIRGSGNGTLVITRGSKIHAAGTLANPIVFTSNAAAGERVAGDWGGIIVLGRAQNNAGENTPIEGMPDNVTSDPTLSGLIQHGGTDNADSSGVITYTRIEFSGIPYSPDNEINSLTMGSVGNRTVMHHIQISYGLDDSFEWFGGSNDMKYLISYAGLDDDFDSDLGFSGRIQFGLIVRDPFASDVSTSNGFESDNNNAGSSATPRTTGIFSNVTLVGPSPVGAQPAGGLFGRGLEIRRNSAISVFNSIVMGWPVGVRFTSAGTGTAFWDETSGFERNIFAGNASTIEFRSGAGEDISNHPMTGNEMNFLKGWPASTQAATVLGNSVKLYPNPVRQDLNIAFELAHNAQVSVNVMDLSGRLVDSLPANQYAAGNSSLRYDTSKLSNGMYIAQIQVNGAVQSARFSVLK